MLSDGFKSSTTLDNVNPLVSGVHQKVANTSGNLQVKAAGLFKYVWPFSGHQTLKA